MALYGTATGLASELGLEKLDTKTVQRFERWLGAIEARIKQRIPDLEALVAGGEIPGELVEDIVIAVAARHARNPDGFRMVSSQVDDAMIRRDYGGHTGRFELLAEEWALLEPREEMVFSILMGMGER